MKIIKKEIIVSCKDALWDISTNQRAYLFWKDQIITQKQSIGDTCMVRAVFKYRQLITKSWQDRLMKREPVIEYHFSTSDIVGISIIEKGEEVGHRPAESSLLLLFIEKEDEKKYYSIPYLQNKTLGIPCVSVPSKGLLPFIQVDFVDIIELKFINRSFVE